MEQMKKYLIDQIEQIEQLEKWDKTKTLSEYGLGKLSAFKDALDKQLILSGVVVPKGTLKTFEDLPKETKDYRKSGDAIVWKGK